MLGASFAGAENESSAWSCTVGKGQASYLEIVFPNNPEQGAFSGSATLVGISPNARLTNIGTVVGEMMGAKTLEGHMSIDINTAGEMGQLVLHLLKGSQSQTLAGYGLGEGLELIFLDCERS